MYCTAQDSLSNGKNTDTICSRTHIFTLILMRKLCLSCVMSPSSGLLEHNHHINQRVPVIVSMKLPITSISVRCFHNCKEVFQDVLLHSITLYLLFIHVFIAVLCATHTKSFKILKLSCYKLYVFDVFV